MMYFKIKIIINVNILFINVILFLLCMELRLVMKIFIYKRNLKNVFIFLFKFLKKYECVS